MRIRPRLLAAATAALAALALPAAAPAAEITSCQFAGLQGGFTPTVPPPPFLGGQFAYSFSGDALNCTHVDTATPSVVNTPARISSSGRYVSDVCGTGSMFGTMTTNLSAPAVADLVYDYTIQFVDWRGVLRGVNGSSTVSGVVTVHPLGTTCALGGVRDFELTGSVEVVL